MTFKIKVGKKTTTNLPCCCRGLCLKRPKGLSSPINPLTQAGPCGPQPGEGDDGVGATQPPRVCPASIWAQLCSLGKNRGISRRTHAGRAARGCGSSTGQPRGTEPAPMGPTLGSLDQTPPARMGQGGQEGGPGPSQPPGTPRQRSRPHGCQRGPRVRGQAPQRKGGHEAEPRRFVLTPHRRPQGFGSGHHFLPKKSPRGGFGPCWVLIQPHPKPAPNPESTDLLRQQP